MEKEKRIRGLADTLLILLITIVTGTILKIGRAHV